MLNIIINNSYKLLSLVFFSLNILIAIYFSNKIFQASWPWKVFIALITFFSINTINSLVGFYLAGNQIDRWFILGTNAVLLIAGGIIIWRYNYPKIIIYNPHIYISFGIFTVFFIFLLISTNMEFLPIWGNTDEIHHFEMVSLLYNKLSVENPLKYKGLGDLNVKLETFSYLWAYHFNCSLIAYNLHLNILYVSHVLRCFAAAMVAAIPILMIKNKSRWSIILYVFLITFNYWAWYSFLNSGYTPNIFSLMFCWITICILCNIDNNKLNNLEKKFILPVAVIMGLSSYLVSGLFLLLFVVYYYYCKNSIRSVGWVFAWCVLLIPQPAIWGQIMFFIRGTGSVSSSIVDNTWMKTKPSMLWMIVAIIVILLFISIMKNHQKTVLWEFLYFTVSIVTLFLYIFNAKSYMMNKVLRINALLFMVFMCEYIQKICTLICGSFIKKATACILGFGTIWMLNKAQIVSVTFPPFPLNEVRKEITRDRIKCFDYMLDLDMNENYSVEYLGADGPTAYMGDIILGKGPYSYKEEDTKWRFKGNFSARNFVNAVMEGGGERIMALVDCDNLNDSNIMNRYSFLFHDADLLYKSGNCEVREFDVDDNWEISCFDIEYLKNLNGLEPQQIQGYGESVILMEKEDQILMKLKLEGTKPISFIDISGRVINDSEFIIRGIEKGQIIYEKRIEEFSDFYLLVPDKKLMCDEIDILATSKIFSDSIIINNIYIGSN